MSEFHEEQVINPVERELDREFLQLGFSQEVESAKDREARGEKEGYGRTSFVAARSAELGVPPELDEDIKGAVIENLKKKKAAGDAWGIAFQSRYMQEMNDADFEDELFFSEKEEELIEEELNKRQEKAIEDPKKWGEFFAMADHVKEVAPALFEKLAINELSKEGLATTLAANEDNIANFVHIAYCAENCQPGILANAGFEKQMIIAKAEQAVAFAKSKKDEGDVWMYSFVMSQAKRLWNAVEHPAEAV